MKPLNDYQKQMVVIAVADTIGLEKEEVTQSSSLKNDLGFDSLDAVELTIQLERIFNVDIPDSEIEKVEVVSDIYEMLINCH